MQEDEGSMSTTSQYYEALSKMPPLRHSVGEVFDIEKSEVVKWVIECPGFKQWLFNKISCTGRIVYDETTGTWSGAPYRKPERGFKEWRLIQGGMPGGRPKKYQDDDLLKILTKPMRVAEVAAAAGCSRPTALTILKRLEAAGKARSEDRLWVPVSAVVETVDVE